jgi:hypothetical protein
MLHAIEMQVHNDDEEELQAHVAAQNPTIIPHLPDVPHETLQYKLHLNNSCYYQWKLYMEF